MIRMNTLAKVAPIAFSFALAACSGGGGDSPVATTSTTPTISGVASAGAPIGTADISIVSLANGQVFYPSGKTAVDGKFSFSIDTAAYPAPYVIRIVGSNQEAPTYSYIASANSPGVVVTPFSTAAISLGANASPEAVFNRTTAITATQFQAGRNLIFAAGKDIFNALGATDESKLFSNTAYVADGTGVDAALDVMAISNPSKNTGQTIVTTKLSSKSVLVSNGDSPAAVSSLSVHGGRAQSVINGINTTNNCLREAINANDLNKWSNQCLDGTFKDEGRTDKASILADARADLPIPIVSIPAASVKWCDFDDINLNFSSPAGTLANQSGVCYATFRHIAASGISIPDEGYYRFTLDGTGNAVSSVKYYGNQLDAWLEVRPAIISKSRVDGEAGNTGVRSGYEFVIGTGLVDGNTTIGPGTPLSAKVEVLDHTQSVIDTFHMQCVQGASCLDSELTVCTDASCSQVGTHNLRTSLVSVNSTLSGQIVAALQQGPVRAKITAYNKIMSDGTKAVVYTRTVPIVGVPIPQSEADTISFPSLTSAGISALAAWSGLPSLTINFERGNTMVNFVGFGSVPGLGVPWTEVSLLKGETSAVFSGVSSSNGSTINPIVAGCGTYRAVYFQGTYLGLPVETKWFGACGPMNY